MEYVDIFSGSSGAGQYLHKYVRSRMTELASLNQLSLTACFNQPSNMKNCCSEVLHGHRIRSGEQFTHEEIPVEIESFKVRLKNLTGQPIKYKVDVVPGPRRPYKNGYVQPCKPIYKEFPAGEFETDVRTAWRLLSTVGKDCVYPGDKNVMWKVEELAPSLEKTEKGKK